MCCLLNIIPKKFRFYAKVILNGTVVLIGNLAKVILYTSVALTRPRAL